MDNNQLLEQSTAVAQRAAESIGGNFEQGVGFKPQPSNVLDAERVANARQVSVPEAPKPLDFSDEITSEVKTSQLIREQQQQAAIKQQELDTARKAVEDRVARMTGTLQQRPELEEKAGLPELNVEIAQLEGQIDARQLKMMRDIQRAEKNLDGKLAGAVEADIARITRDANMELADLAIIQSAKTRNAQALQSNIDRKIELELEPLKLQLEYDKFIYQENKELFTKAEQRAFDLQIKAEEREYDAAKTAKEQIGQIQMLIAESGAPGSLISEVGRATTFEEAMEIGGSYIGLLDRQLKLSQINAIKIENDIAVQKQRQLQTTLENGGYTPEQAKVVSDLTDQLRGEPAYKEMFEVRAGYNTATVGFEQNSGFGDIAMVNGYQRMIDPGATVRGEDINTQAEAVAFIQRVLNVKGRVVSGDRFTEETRELLNEAIQDQYKRRVDNFESTTKARYENVIQRNPTLQGADVSFNDIGDEFSIENGTTNPVDPKNIKLGEEFILGGQTYIKVGDDAYEIK